MNGLPKRRSVAIGVTTAAVFFLGTGVLLLFASREIGAALGTVASESTLLQLLGAALLGFGTLNWVARRASLGGIYGRAIVVANQVHFSVGAILLLKRGVLSGGSPGYWMLAGPYLVGAVFFNRLLFSSGSAPVNELPRRTE